MIAKIVINLLLRMENLGMKKRIPYQWFLDLSCPKNPKILNKSDVIKMKDQRNIYFVILDTGADRNYITFATNLKELKIPFPNGGNITLETKNLVCLSSDQKNTILIGRSTIYNLVNDFGYRIGTFDEKIREIKIKNAFLRRWQLSGIDTGTDSEDIHIYFPKKFENIFMQSDSKECENISILTSKDTKIVKVIRNVKMDFKIDGEKEEKHLVNIALHQSMEFDIPIITTAFLNMIKKSIDADIVCKDMNKAVNQYMQSKKQTKRR